MSKRKKESKKPTRGVVIELTPNDLIQLRELQSRFILVGCDKAIANIALDCLREGLHNKILNTAGL